MARHPGDRRRRLRRRGRPGVPAAGDARLHRGPDDAPARADVELRLGGAPRGHRRVAAAIATPPVEDAIRDFAVRAHEQVFRARAACRVDLDAQQVSTSIRSALQSINPALAKKLPANVLDASASISQNRMVDLLFRMSSWIWLWIPTGILGIALLVQALRRAADPVRAVRTSA